MIIGIPKEIKEQENRVGLLPSGAQELKKRGHKVLVERGAGQGSGYADSDYANSGAQVVADHDEVFHRADLIVKVKEPQAEEYGLFRGDQILENCSCHNVRLPSKYFQFFGTVGSLSVVADFSIVKFTRW